MKAQEAAGTSTITFGVGGGWIASHPYGTGGGPAFKLAVTRTGSIVSRFLILPCNHPRR